MVRRRRVSEDQQFHGIKLGSFSWIFKEVRGFNWLKREGKGDTEKKVVVQATLL
jgi:hypothetical protein